MFPDKKQGAFINQIGVDSIFSPADIDELLFAKSRDAIVEEGIFVGLRL